MTVMKSITIILTLSLLLFSSITNLCAAQDCPPNIDFESGTFNGWRCYTGAVAAISGENVISLNESGPVNDRHTIVTSSSGIDPYGGFPMLCPNGSGASIRLGNPFGGGQAEGVSYEFTIPADRDKYNLIYHYAVVFQDPNHEIFQQPRMEIEVMNMTDNQLIECSSFTFIPYGTVLPGFFESSNPGTPTPVWCKDWTAVTINLDGHAGKTIRLFFKTADCTFVRHFGYAYIDVDTDCSGTFLGATFCKDDQFVNVVAPYGYQSYTWYDSTLTNVLGSNQILTLRPAPKPGTTIAVKVEPYSGYGCPKTLYARLVDTLTIIPNAGRDALSCNGAPVQLGAPPKPGVLYSWQPSTGINSPNIANPFASPTVTTSYILTTQHDGGGCVGRDTVVVKASLINNGIVLNGKSDFCIDSEDSAVLHVEATNKIQWFRNGSALLTATQPDLHVHISGEYYAVLSNSDGCVVKTDPKRINIESPVPGVRYPVQYAIENIESELQARDIGFSYLWAPANYLSNPETAKPTFTGNREQLYLINITTAGGCLTVDTLVVKTVKNANIAVPTAFTPNNDGLNDYLTPTLMGIKQLKYFRVFNRWGQLLYESAQERPGWNGSFKGVPQPTGAVVWVAEGIGVDGQTYRKKGTSVLIR